MEAEKNTLNKEMELFIEKLQKISADLYEEFTQTNDEGIVFSCPLVELVDKLYVFSKLSKENIIDETLELY